MMLLVWPPVTLFKFAPAGSALINRHCFLFAAHHHSRFGLLINLMPATYYVSCLHQTYNYKHRNLFTRFSILTQQSSQVQLTTPYTTAITYLHHNKLTYSTSLVSSVSHSHHEQQITRHLRALIQAPIQTMNLSSVHVHDGYIVVKEKRISRFKEEWERILEEHEIAEPFWSVKWIVEHVLRKYSHSEVYIMHLSLSLSSLSHIIRAN